MQTPTRPKMNPALLLFIKLTAVVAIAIVLLVIAFYLLKIVVIAAVIAAIGVGGFLLYNLIRRRSNYPSVR